MIGLILFVNNLLKNSKRRLDILKVIQIYDFDNKCQDVKIRWSKLRIFKDIYYYSSIIKILILKLDISAHSYLWHSITFSKYYIPLNLIKIGKRMTN